MATMLSYLSLHHNFSNFSSRISPALALLTNQLSLRNSPEKIPVEFSRKELRFSRWDQLQRQRGSVETPIVRLMGMHTPSILGVMRWPARCSGLAWLHHARVWFGGRSMLQLGGARWLMATPRLQIEGWKGMVMWSSVAWSCGASRPSSLIAAADADLGDKEIDISEGLKIVETLKIYGDILVTGFLFFTWYLLSIMFSIHNKNLFTYFPYPFFISAVHLLVSVTYCLTSWSLGLRKWTPININLLGVLIHVAACHALGHVMSNISFTHDFTASFTRIIPALEPLFTAAASQFIFGHQIPSSLWLSLAPLIIGVSMASWTGFFFNWSAFTKGLVSNISITFRNIYSKKAMTGMDSTSLYAYISIIALLFCLPAAILIDGPKLMQHDFLLMLVEVGIVKFAFHLLGVGMLYHVYNQITFNILERVAPLTHAVGNVFKYAFVIGFSIIVFGTSISTHNGIGVAMAIAGVAFYSWVKANLEDQKKEECAEGKDILNVAYGLTN